jgi:hypothetical protein
MWRVDQSLKASTSGYWHIHDPVTSKRKKIGPVTGKGKNYFDAAVDEVKRRNLKYYGEEVNVVGNDKFNAEGNWIGPVEEEYRIEDLLKEFQT